ncbi:MAG: hypothetical protein KAT17_08185 [Candidatus Aminicenantes bacterium]|nr:hypothetical protein [Candidatus Aminicenantes bacterium]
MSLKKMIMICLVLMFFIQVAPAQTEESIAHYKRQARNLINQAITLGPTRGYQKIMNLNRDNGVWGAAAWVARRDPEGAAQIMIEAGRTLINFGNITGKQRPGAYPQKNHYYTWASDSLSKALKYINEFAKQNPLAASDMAIQVSLVFFNANPGDKYFRDMYRSYALTFLSTNNSLSALSHAGKIKNTQTRKLQTQKIKNQQRSMGL